MCGKRPSLVYNYNAHGSMASMPHLQYYPYGDTSYRAGRSISEVSQKRYRYTGKEKDEESGLYYHGARYYACWLGRWTAADPAGLVDGVNLYMYCRGNPTGLVDEDGMESEKTDIGFKSSKKISSNEEFISYLSSGGTFEYEGKEYYLSFDGELNIEVIDGVSQITGENLYAHEVPARDNANIDDDNMIFEAVDVKPEDESNVYGYAESAADNTRVARFSGETNGIGNKALKYGLNAAISTAGEVTGRAMKKISDKIMAEEGPRQNILQKRTERLKRSGRGENYKPLLRNSKQLNISNAKIANARLISKTAMRGVPVVGAVIGGAIEYNANIRDGDEAGLAASKAVGGAMAGLLGGYLVGKALVAIGLGSTPIGLAIVIGFVLSELGSYFGGYLYGFSQ